MSKFAGGVCGGGSIDRCVAVTSLKTLLSDFPYHCIFKGKRLILSFGYFKRHQIHFAGIKFFPVIVAFFISRFLAVRSILKIKGIT